MITVDKDTKIDVITTTGQRASLPAAWIFARMQTGETYRDERTGEPIAIERLGETELLDVATNYSSWHRFAVDGKSILSKWDGSSVAAAACNNAQLLGRYGMYVVQRARPTLCSEAYRGNFSTVEGVYVHS